MNIFAKFFERNFILLENDLINSKECNSYRKFCATNTTTELEKILRVQEFKCYKKKIIPKFKKRRDFFFYRVILFFIRINAKFQFNGVRFFIELIHLYMEAFRLAINIIEIKKSKSLIEFNSNSDIINDSFIFYPSFKKQINNLNIQNISIKRMHKSAAGIYEVLKYSSYISKFLKSKKKIMFFIIYLPVRLLDGMFCALSESKNNVIIYTNGSMNLFNRALSIVALHNDFKVVLKDHGLVRDCVAEQGIFSTSIGFQNQKGPDKEL